MCADDQHALEARFAHPLRQILHAFIAKELPGLIRAVLNLVIEQRLYLLARLRLAIDDLIDRRFGIGLPAPADPRAALFAHCWSSRKSRICAAARRYSCAMLEAGAKSARVIPCAGASAAATARRMGAKRSGTRSAVT